MKERPILFSAPLVRAILAGTKTQTRRLAKHPLVAEADRFAFDPVRGEWELGQTHQGPVAHVGFARCPFGTAGDRLWVREAWAPQPGREDTLTLEEHDGGRDPSAICYRADERNPGECKWYPEGVSFGVQRWRPSIHMPRWASRIALEVTRVRAERLQDIGEDDARAEGVDSGWPHRSAFATLWDRINGKREGASWGSNPWVWVVEFRRVT